MPTINTNIAANAATGYLNVNMGRETGLLAELGSGSRINQASDDAAGLAIGTQLQANVTVYQQDLTNVAQGQSLLQTADGGLAQISNILQRMTTLATEAASGQVTNTQRYQDLNTEYQQLASQIDTIGAQTQYGGQSLLTWQNSTSGFSWFSNSVLQGYYEAMVEGNTQFGSADNQTTFAGNAGFAWNQNDLSNYGGGVAGLPSGGSGTFNTASLASLIDGPAYGVSNFLTGTSASDVLGVSINPINTTSLGLTTNIVTFNSVKFDSSTLRTGQTTYAQWLAANPNEDIPGNVYTTVQSQSSNISTASAALSSLGVLTQAMNTVTQVRAQVGGWEQRFNFSSQDIQTNIQNLSAAESVIMDADVAAVKSSLSAADVQCQASVAALTQASQLPSELLKFLQSS